MEDFIFYNNLYDIYGELLTLKEQSTFKDYYHENFSLSEIAENNNVSRSAVQKTLKTVIDKLINYENKLGMYSIKLKLTEILSYNNIEKVKEVLLEVINEIGRASWRERV